MLSIWDLAVCMQPSTCWWDFSKGSRATGILRLSFFQLVGFIYLRSFSFHFAFYGRVLIAYMCVAYHGLVTDGGRYPVRLFYRSC